VLAAAARPLDLSRDPAAIDAAHPDLHATHPDAQAGHAVDALEAGVAVHVDADGAALGVVESEALGLTVHGCDLALELAQRSLRAGDGGRGEHCDGCDESDEFHVVRVPGALSSIGEPRSKLS
jgi:hypothetical protein